MAVPAVTCGAKIVVAWNESGGFYNAYFSATATGSPTNWTWTILSVPIGLEAILSGSWGDFANGVAMGPTMQGPSLTGIPTNVVAGTIVVQCVATNGDGPSVPTVDKGAGQQCVVIKTELLDLPLPGNKEYNWGGAQLDEVLRKLETAAATSPPLAHQASHVGGADQIPTATTGARGLLPLLGGGTANFLRADGTWNAPPGGLDTTAIHKATAAEISAITAKTSPIAADLLLIEDSANSNNKKSVQIGNLPAATVSAKGLLPILGGGTSNFLRADGTWNAPPGGLDTTAIHKATSAEISALTLKPLPIGTDLLLIEDSAGSVFDKKKIAISTLPTGGGGFSGVPGVSIEMLKKAGSTQSVTSGTFVDLTGVSGSFVAPVAGLYDIVLRINGVYGGSGGDSGAFRAVFDAAGTPQYIGASDYYSTYWTTSALRPDVDIRGSLILTAGTHTIKVEALKNGGSSLNIDSLSTFIVNGTLVSGSGAGGVIVTTATPSTNPIVVDQLAYTNIAGLSFSINTTANETVTLNFKGNAYILSGNTNSYVQWYIDGAALDAPLSSTSVASSTSIDISFSRTYTFATAGSHTVTIQGKYLTIAWSLYDCVASILQYRGGLVPIQKDGVDVVGTPRAINFQGGAVTVDQTSGVANIRLNDAITAPGVSIEMLNTGPTTTRSTTSTSFVGIGVPAVSEPGEVIGTFVAPIAGIYELNMDLTAQGSANWGFYRLVIDYNGTPIYVGGDNTWRRAHYSSDARGYHFNATATLTAGIHTIKLEWKVASGTIYMQEASISSAVYVRATLVSGSGAGGVLVSEKTDTSQRDGVTGPNNWTAVTQLAHTITTAGEWVQLIFNGMANTVGSAGTPQLGYRIDSGSWIALAGGSNAQNWTGAEGVSAFVQLTAGQHTIDFGIASVDAADCVLRGDFITSRTQVIQFRGGLVPIRKDGVSITDTPAAFDFVGPGCQVTNVGGTATIALLGAEGVIKTEASDSSDRTGSGATPSEGSNTLGLSITTAANEVVMISLTGTFYPMAAVSTVTSWYKIDSGSWVGMISAGGNAGYPQTLSWTAYPTIAIAGSHTISFAFSNINGNSWTLGSTTIGPSAKSTCIQFRGGYVHPENVPILEYSSATVVNVKAGPGASSELRVLLNDGRRYTHTGTLTFNITTSGLGGRDTGSESNDIWYLYLVPGAVSGDLAVVGSITAPSTGPTGYSIWRYIGAVRNSTDILKFYQDGAYFGNAAPSVLLDFTGAWVADGAIQTCTLTGYVPACASAVDAQVYFQANGTGTMFSFVYGDEDISTATTRWNTSKIKASAPSTNSGQSARSMIPLPAATKRFTYIRDAYLNSRIEVQGWTDGWLSGANSVTAAVSLGDWETVLDLDFSAQPSQTISPDGPYTIGGKTWAKINSANDSVVMAVVNGSGLVIQPKSTGDYYAGVRTLPAITIPLMSLIPNIHLSAPIRVTAYVSAINRAANYDAFIISIENPTPMIWFDARINYETAVRVAAVHIYNNGSLGNIGVDALSTKNVVQMELTSGIQQMLASWRAGDWAGGWPLPSSLLPYAYRAPTGATMYPAYSGATNIIGAVTAWNLLVGAMRAGSGTALSVTVARIKVEVKV